MDTSQATALRVREIPPTNSVKETAGLLGYNSQTPVYGLLSDGKLKSVVIGGKRRITGESIIKLLRASEQEVYAPTREAPKKRASRLERERAVA